MSRPTGGAARALALGALLLAIAGSVDCGKSDEPAANSAPLQPLEAPPAPPASERRDASEPLARNTVEVYFPSILGDGLVGEYSEIFETITPGDRVKQIVADLIAGPNNPEAVRALPAGTRLRQAYVLDSGVCYLDFTNDLKEGVGGGSMEELLTVYAVVDSVVYNVREVKRVALLVEGQPVDTLNGHLDLRRPLAPDFSLILAPVVVEADPAARPAEARRPPADPTATAAEVHRMPGDPTTTPTEVRRMPGEPTVTTAEVCGTSGDLTDRAAEVTWTPVEPTAVAEHRIHGEPMTTVADGATSAS